jgi:hypothetical protein
LEEAVKVSDLISTYREVGDPFGTHLNLLRALGPGTRSVLELGAGRYSTPLFLDRSAYPDLVQLSTIESDPEWAKECNTSDLRHFMVSHDEPIEPYLERLTLVGYDLILCDNSTSGERRCDTLRWLASHVRRSLVVVHDYDVPSYAEACNGLDLILVDDRQSPHTALLRRAK